MTSLTELIGIVERLIEVEVPANRALNHVIWAFKPEKKEIKTLKKLFLS